MGQDSQSGLNMRRFSSIFKKDKDKSVQSNSTNSTAQRSQATTSVNKQTANGPAGKQPQQPIQQQNQAVPPDQPDHSISRDDVTTTFEKYAKVLHAALRPLPDQTGDGSYVEDPVSGNLFGDLKAMRIKDFETLEMTLKHELSGSKLTDDRTMLMEKTIQLVANLPPNSKNRVELTDTFVDQLWNSLVHPPNPQSHLGDENVYRQPDGSNNNPLFPDIGKAGTVYARSVPPVTMQPASLPDPGVIFDSIMDRDRFGFQPHPNKVSSMLYYIASIIIHDCFRTSHENFNISQTSSYLDLSPLYGSFQVEQDEMRTFKDGKIKPDCFAEKRLFGFPPGVGCILIMFNRFHNYAAEQLAVINEAGRFNKPKQNLEGKKKDDAWKKYDNDLFQTARLVTGGLYINVILLDYLRTIVNLNRTNSTWTLDPRVAMEESNGSPRGTGNQVSCEFNLVYRWHSCISQRDEEWTEELYQKLFHKSSSEVSMPELLAGLGKLEELLPEDPLKRDFGGLQRGDDGTFNDDDLVKILTESIEDTAGASGANNIPKVMRAVEILGIEQARVWKTASFNEFRKFFGLTPHKEFTDINPDPYVADQLKRLYDHPDFVELHVGLVTEAAKEPMVPGVGITPTYTISRAILSDAVTLVRGDRFYTTDYHPRSLTNWGFTEVQYDLNVNQGCVFYKLFLRAFPNHFKYNSIYAHYPLTIPSENALIMKNLKRTEDYSWDRPARVLPRINVTSYNGVMAVLKNPDVFKVTWGEGLGYLMGKPGRNFMLSGDGPFFKERREMMGKCLYQDQWKSKIRAFYEDVTIKLLRQWSYKLGDTNQVDIIRDIGNSAHVHFASAIFHLPLKTKENPHGVFEEHELYMVLAVIFTVIFMDFDITKTFPLRKAGLEVTQALGQLVETNVSLISNTGLLSAIVDPFMEQHNALKDYGVHMVRQLLKSGLGVHETTWSQILPTAGAMVANQGQVFGQVIDFYLSDEGKVHLPEINRLAKLNTDAADDTLLHYLLEGVRLHGTFGAYRRAASNTTIDENGKKLVFEEGRNAFVSFLQIARDPNVYPNPNEVRLDRPVDSYIVYGEGSHQCLGGEASRAALTAMFKVVGRLDNLRKAVGPTGEQKKIPREGGFYAYMDPLQSHYWPYPTTMRVNWDGEIGEPFKH